MTKEIWKDVVGYEGKYMVSDLGNVKSMNYKLGNLSRGLSKTPNMHGYYKVGLCKNGIQKTKQVHQLVAESFLGHVPCGHKLMVNHIDFNRKNNKSQNLELVTARENSNLKHIKSSSVFVGVTWDKSRSIWISRIRVNGKLICLGRFKKEQDASYAYQERLKLVTGG